MKNFIIKTLAFSVAVMFLSSCGMYKYSDARKNPTQGVKRAEQNVKTGKGVSIGKALKNRGSGTNYEFNTSNPLWRASLETLDFLPLSTVDYSGGMIISDWYSENSSNNEAIKISLRFLSNDVRTESLKVIIHKKVCTTTSNCKISLLNKSKIKEELHFTIIKKAAVFEKELKK
jgi:hypothetical protein